MLTQLHLKGKGFSGRAVRLRELAPAEVEANLTAAAKLAGKEAGPLEIKKIEWRNAVKMMIVEFTEPCADPMADGVKWRKVSPGMLEDMGEYFKAKDVALLEHFYRDQNEVLQDEVDDILGKALPVAQ